MAKILIGNIKGPQGPQGPQGEQGPVGPQGPQGPLPPLVNNALATEAGVAALDAVMGKTLQEQITNNKNDITELNSNLNNGKLMRAYSTAFVFGKTIPGNSTDNQFDLNIASLGLSEKPSYLSLIPSTAKISNIRYDYDNSSSSIAKIIFDNNGGEINADSYVRFSIIVFA